MAVEVDGTFFEQRILPVFEDHCYKCHSAKAGKAKGGLQLDTPNRMKLGGDTGPVFDHENPARSLILQAVEYNDPDLEMPPKNKLDDDAIADIRAWVHAGAPDNRVASSPHDAAFIAETRSRYSQISADELWSFQPIRKTPPAHTGDGSWASTPVDRYVLAELEARGLKPVADAGRATLIRRVYFDLIGLPPTPEEAQAFIDDRSPDALANVIDQLLASDRFGERWGRHWLDVARYAESNGGDSNVTYPHAWRYRDYVIDAFNADKPYDRFITEQIAGDLLDAANDEQRAEQIVATGFLAIGPKNLNERNYTQFKLDLIDEQIDAVTRAFLGVTVACARCHDHKFDPVSAKDYYAMAGIFSSSNTQYGTLRTTDFNNNSDGLTPIPVTDETKTTGYMSPAERARIEQQMDDIRRQLVSLRGPGGRPRGGGGQRPVVEGTMGMDAVQVRRTRLRLNNTYDALEARLYDYDESGNAYTHAMAVVEGRAENSPLYLKGEASNPGEIVPRGFVSALTDDSTPEIPYDVSGRLELARWITGPDNPLTARVMVNRIWGKLFGRGLVTTTDNFGAMGQKPTHPELLDHLALEFKDNGWSVKKMIRSLMLTRAYRLASTVDHDNYEIDPDNTYLWRAAQRRLEAETLRDTVLYMAGWLDERPLRSQTYDIGDTPLGGRRGFRANFFNFDVTYRSVYLPILRDSVPDVLALFDFAEPNMIIGQRTNTVVPSQALFLMNSDFIQNASHSFGRWLANDFKSDNERVGAAYRWVLTRTPDPSERKGAIAFIKRYAGLMEAEGQDAKEAVESSYAALTQSLYGAAEFRFLR
ncbi:MAG: PSD1 and planctomycete cytochrome C domain-containing protein [Planctomycetota bacterium]